MISWDYVSIRRMKRARRKYQDLKQWNDKNFITWHFHPSNLISFDSEQTSLSRNFLILFICFSRDFSFFSTFCLAIDRWAYSWSELERAKRRKRVDWIVERGEQEQQQEQEEEHTKIYKLGLMFNYLDRIGLKSARRVSEWAREAERRTNLKEALNSITTCEGFSEKKIPLSLSFTLSRGELSFPPAQLILEAPPPLNPSRFWQSTHFHLNICSITHRANNKNFLTSSKTVREQKFAYNQVDCHKSSFFFVSLLFWRLKTREEKAEVITHTYGKWR